QPAGPAGSLARAPAHGLVSQAVRERIAAAGPGDLFGEVDERATDLRIVDLRIGAHQANRARGFQEAQPTTDAVVGGRGSEIAGEEECDRHVENISDAREAACADAIDDLLVFLHLAKGYAEVVSAS